MAGQAALALAAKDAALLAFVAFNNGVSSTRVATLVWPGATERGALNNLRQRVFRLRGKTGARLLEVSTTASLAEDLQLEPMPDLAALEADAHAWDAELLQGIELDDETELSAWLAAERKAWAARRRDALAGVASACERAGELVRALNHARRLLLDDPLSEHAHRRLMRLHYQRGDTASAVAAFEACEAVLKDELGLQPSAETLALLQTIERGRPPATAAPGPVPATLLRPPRAVGRHAERAQLAQALADGQIAALVGEAGMGKTRLLLDFIAAQAQAVYAQARPGDAAVPYGVLARLLRALLAAAPAALAQAPRSELARVAPEWGEGAVALAGSTQAPRLQAAIEQVMVEALAAGVATLVVDDLHFADPASVEMLRALVDADALSGMRWAFAHRPIGAADDNGALLRALADSPRARWIVLAPLTDADLVELLDSLALPGIGAAEFAPALARHTGGNPLYVLETLREARLQPARAGVAASFSLPRPRNIAHMIDRRLQRLSEPAMSLARVAALAGADFSPQLAEHALGVPVLALSGAWAELEAADVLRGNVFAHDLVRDGMLRATPAVIAVHAHRLIAQYLAAHAADPARVAPHWLLANEHRAAATAFRAAAQRAKQASRPREEAQLLREAADAFACAGDLEDEVVCRAHAIPPTIRSEGPRPALVASQRLVDAQGGGHSAGLVLAVHAVALIWSGHAAEAERVGREALLRLVTGDETLRMEVARTVAVSCGLQGRPAEGLDLLRPWMNQLDEVGELADRIEFCGNYTNLLLQGDRPGEALAVAVKHRDLARQAGDVLEEVTALINAASAAVRRGEQKLSISHGMAAAALDSGGEQSRILFGLNDAVLGYGLCGDGRYREGLARLDSARREAHALGPGSVFLAMAEELQAVVMLQLGQPAKALQLLAEDHPNLVGHRRANRLLTRVMAGDRKADAEQALLEVIDIAGSGPGTHVRMTAQLQLARVQAPELAIERCGIVRDWALATECLPVAALASALRLDALRQSDRLAGLAAETHDVENAARKHRAPQPYFPEMLLICAKAYRALQREEDAARCVRDGMAWFMGLALPEIPEEFRDGFLRRNRVNMELQAMASQQPAIS